MKENLWYNRPSGGGRGVSDATGGRSFLWNCHGYTIFHSIRAVHSFI